VVNGDHEESDDLSGTDTNRFWADYIVEQLRIRAKTIPRLAEIVAERGYIVYDEKTPSGSIHIGPGRGWLIHDTVARALRNTNLNGRFILSSDDMDPMDDLPPYIDPSYVEYMGIPLRNIPSPDGSSKSFGQYFFDEATSKFREYGIEAELESTGDRYVRGDFDWTIKKALDNADIIDRIYTQFYGKPLGRLPFNPICENCGKIGTTIAHTWDKENEIVKYRCSPDLVKWAKGCNHEGEINPYKGNGKLPWKVEWAAKWPTVGVIYEIAGKDHFSRGGSRSIAIHISDQVFGYHPPYPSTPTKTGKGHEFFTIEGKKMSTSKGFGMTFAEMTDFAPGHILRYMFVRTRPQSAIEFNIQGTDKLLALYDAFDRSERIYFGLEAEDVSEKEIVNQKRLYELAQVGKIPERMPMQVTFSYCVTLVQVTNTIEEAIQRLKSTGHLEDTLEDWELEHVTGRLKAAKRFLVHAPERLKITLSKPARKELEKNQVSALKEFSALLVLDLDEEQMKEKMGVIMKNSELKPKALFKLLYQVITGKSRGPRLTPFIKAIGRQKVKKIIDKTIELST
jgi:lysyl-tRNA synthetase class 1